MKKQKGGKRQLLENKACSKELAKNPRTSIVADTFGSMIGKYTQMNKKLTDIHLSYLTLNFTNVGAN